MQVTILLFARLRDITGSSELKRELPDGATVQFLWDNLEADYKELSPYRETISTAINAEYTKMDSRLTNGDEVAFLPPVSGG